MKLPPKGRVIAYGRVSSREQAENQHAAEQQRDRLISYGCDQLFFDIESGNSKTRPNFIRMMDEVEKGDVELIIATRWDRITRNESIYLSFKETLRSNQIRLYLLDQGEVDLSTASGELSADMQAIFAVHERRMLRERVKRGHSYRRKRKVAWTRAPFGYTIQNDCYVLDEKPIICLLEQRPDYYRDFSPDPEDWKKPPPHPLVGISRADIARDAIRTFQAVRRPRKTLRILYERYGLACKAFINISQNSNENSQTMSDLSTPPQRRQKRTNLVLADELLLWSSGSSLIDWLRNPVLRGHTAYCKHAPSKRKVPVEQWEMHHNTHLDNALLTEAEFHEIELTLQANSRKVGTPETKFNLTGLVYCDRCGHKMVLKRNKSYRYYGCRNSTVGCSNRKCVRVEIIDEAIAVQLFKHALQLAQIQDLPSDQPTESKELRELRQQLAAIEAALKAAPSEALKRAQHEIQMSIEQRSRDVELLNFEKATAAEIISHSQARDLGFWHTRTYQERELFYDKLIQKVNICDREIVSIDLKV